MLNGPQISIRNWQPMLRHGHLTFLPNLIIANAPTIFSEKAALHTTSSLGFKGGYSADLFLLKIIASRHVL